MTKKDIKDLIEIEKKGQQIEMVLKMTQKSSNLLPKDKKALIALLKASLRKLADKQQKIFNKQ